ncbi:MAG: GTPase [Symploca sp. SIO1B1]|nr:GTPase [Symploca sp. SIO2D2]NER21285.1 GTPase [Symploca sp. SIO1C2]NER48620.1 GTPase [Symploca sp. SIO1A3]NER94465.1 GTPase [Symploca sp. SIO1B1]
MKTMRLVVAGTPGAGKSTFVQTVSQIEAISTERNATDQTAQFKKKTTVAFDYGRISFGFAMDVQIYGTPGQSRFSFMWDFLIQKAHTYIVLVAAHRPNDFRQARQIITFMNQRVNIPMVIGITHMDEPEAKSPEEILLSLGYMNRLQQPLFVTVNPRDKHSVLEAIMASMALMLSQSNFEQLATKKVVSPPAQTQRNNFYQLSTRSLSRDF